MTTGKTIALTGRTIVGKVMSLLFNILSRLVIASLPEKYPHLSPTPHTPIHDAGRGDGAGRLKEGRAHSQLTVRGYWENHSFD